MKESFLIPLASRLVQFNKRGEHDRLLNLLTGIDKKSIENISQDLYRSGFDVYLPLESLLLHPQHTDSSLCLVAASEIQSLREHFISRLRFAQTQSGSDAWIHFGTTIYYQKGWNIKEDQLGDMFYCNEMSSSPDEITFALSVAVYDGLKDKPSPIDLRIVSSIENQKVLF